MKKVIQPTKAILFLYLCISIFSCQFGNSDDTFHRNTYEEKSAEEIYKEAKISLREQEEMTPLEYLHLEATYRKNLIGEWVLEGDIFNNAQEASYKDVELTISFYSYTDTHLGDEVKVFYDYFAPRDLKEFKIKMFGYEGTETLGAEITKALPLK